MGAGTSFGLPYWLGAGSDSIGGPQLYFFSLWI